MKATTESSTFVQVRQLLDQTERDIVAMRGEPAKVAGVIQQVERIRLMLGNLRAAGVDVRAEQGRADTLNGRLDRDAALVVKRVGQSGAAVELVGSALWNELQATVAARRAQARRRQLTVLGVVVTIGVLLFVVLPAGFPAPPTANITAVSQLVDQGDLDGALARAQVEQANAPDDLQIGLWIAALHQKKGDTAQAQAAWNAARSRYDSEVDYYSDRVQVFLAVGDLAAAERDAEALRALDGGATIGTFFLGSVRELQGNNREAIELYEQAATLADKENRPELVVTARTRMATLMQAGQ